MEVLENDEELGLSVACSPVCKNPQEFVKFFSKEECQQINSIKGTSLKKQRASAYYLAKKLKGNLSKHTKIEHTQTGKPYFNTQDYDLSISHKADKIMVGIIKLPYKIGVDLEYLNTIVDEGIFVKYFLKDAEKIVLKKICYHYGFPVNKGLALFWSIKESVLKCLGLGLKTREIGIININDNNFVDIGFSGDLKRLMKKNKLEIENVTFRYDDENVYSRCIIKSK